MDTPALLRGPRPAATADEYAEVTFSLPTLTLGEAAAAEAATGQSIQALLRAPSSRRILAMFVHELRSSATPRSWHELSSLRLLDVTSSILQSRSAGASETSSD
jgi:hypothetical protein